MVLCVGESSAFVFFSCKNLLMTREVVLNWTVLKLVLKVIVQGMCYLKCLDVQTKPLPRHEMNHLKDGDTVTAQSSQELFPS